MKPDLFTLPTAESSTEAPAARVIPASAQPVGSDGLVVCPHFTLQEHAASGYGPRTFANAEADATWAYAIDFSTSGERLTARAAGARLLQTKVGTPSEEAATTLLAHLRALRATTLNVAGNGLYTLAQHFPQMQPAALQARLDAYVLKVLARVHAQYPLAQVRSGGQSGVDQAGIVAGIALGIPTLALLPHGFRMRTAIGDDISMTYRAAWRRFLPNPSTGDDPW